MVPSLETWQKIILKFRANAGSGVGGIWWKRGKIKKRQRVIGNW
jgi:hypothetical protein